MSKEELMAFANSVNANRFELSLKFMFLDLCTEAYREQEKQCDAIYDQVLQSGDYRVNRPDYEPNRPEDPKPGDRVTSEFWMFLLSDEDFAKVLNSAAPIMKERGITDENGNYVVNWMMRMLDAEKDVDEFFIKKIIPPQLQGIFWDNRRRVTVMKKMREIARAIVDKRV